MNKLIFSTRTLGEGAFGKVFLAQHQDTGEFVAVKYESADVTAKQLEVEASVLRALNGKRNIPPLLSFGPWKGGLALVMPRLGPSLESLRREATAHKLSITSVAWVAVEALQAIRRLHKKGLLHRDIKPDNMLTNHASQPRGFYLIDYGMAKHYVDAHGAHIPWINGKSFLGTPRFGSRWTHQGEQQSRRDDMVCLAYSLLYLVNGSLPWQGIPARRKGESSDTAILAEKIRCTADILGRDLPQQFRDFLSASLHLEFTEEPDYSKWIRRFSRLLPDHFLLDWEITHADGADAPRRSSKRRDMRVGEEES